MARPADGIMIHPDESKDEKPVPGALHAVGKKPRGRKVTVRKRSRKKAAPRKR
jgi:hypothetical protein